MLLVIIYTDSGFALYTKCSNSTIALLIFFLSLIKNCGTLGKKCFNFNLKMTNLILKLEAFKFYLKLKVLLIIFKTKYC